jgi:hypothetical protein
MTRDIHPDDPNGTPLPPGAPFYGIVYSDGSAGSWNPDHAEVEVVVAESRDIGLMPIGILCVRMKTETLVVAR